MNRNSRFINDLDTDGDGKIDVRYPNWQYQVRDAKLNIDNLDTVLRNARVSFADSQNRRAGCWKCRHSGPCSASNSG